MSEVRLVIRDEQRDIQADRHGSFADRVIAALSAEPETIEELDAALERFIARGKGSYFHGFSLGIDDRLHDAGLVVIDLAARLVVCDSTCLAATPEGWVTYHDGKQATDVVVYYHLSGDWLLANHASGWRVCADERRRSRRLNPPLDGRAVIYGEPLLRFIAEQCFEVFRDRGAPPEVDYTDPDYQRQYDLLRDIHIRWMMTPRDDLRSRSPRQIMTVGQRFVSSSMQDRETQWSFTGQCPPGLDPDSAAYRLGAFGIHEAVVYYDLVRELLWRCRENVTKRARSSSDDLTREAFVADEILRLVQFCERWLDLPYSDLGQSTARSIIHNERARIPEGMSEQEAIVDSDCPLCEMQAELPGPVFLHLDGSHMDNEFAFSLWHETYEEWEQEQREREDFSRRFDARYEEQQRLGVEYPGGGYADPDFAWKRSFSAPESSEAPLSVRLFAIGSYLSELIVDLKAPPRDASCDRSRETRKSHTLVDRLTRVFRNLRKVVGSPDCDNARDVILPVLTDFRDALDIVAGERPDLAIKCVDLRNRLGRFLEPPSETSDVDWFGDDCRPC